MFSGPLKKDVAEKLAKRQFIAGFFFLPWLWMSNYFFFWDIQKENEVIRKYCKLSLLCFCISCVVALTYWFTLATFHPDSSLWVIHPGQDEFQSGIWTKQLDKYKS
eukprot:TRINITY_DN27463_c0_g1_i1.p1 TRINITY_DN27463_c0_g1~~TRINITY_DN27463_c0_g1_i1.p1  ORF type:complete len:123 (+),score=15.13 TRINITY_DN27463_c0_g1_i1:52-369(+)